MVAFHSHRYAYCVSFLYTDYGVAAGLPQILEFYELRYDGKSAAFSGDSVPSYLGVVFNVIIMGTACFS
jgi:hypothetical protein